MAPEWHGIKAQILSCLRVFVSCTLNYSSLHTYFEQVLAQAIKVRKAARSLIDDIYEGL